MHRPRERSFCGIFTALITPFNKAGDRVHYESLGNLVAYLVEQGAHGFFVCGGAGEAAHLGMVEREWIAEVVVHSAKGRPVIVHVGSTSIEASLQLAVHANSIEADGGAYLGDFYHGDPKYQIANFNRITNATELPFFAYFVDSPDSHRPFNKFLACLRHFKGLAGVKLTSQKIERVRSVCELSDPINRWSVFSGKDIIFLEALRAGADGAISALANIMAGAMVKVYNLLPLFRADAAAENERLQKINSQLFKTNNGRPNNIAVIKQILYQQGIIASPAVRNGQAACPAKRADSIIELMQ